MKIMRMVCCLCLLLVSLLIILPSGALAQDESPPEEKIELTATHTTLEAESGGSFEFEVKLKYQGTEARIFDLSATGPKDWSLFITPSYPKDKRIKDVRIEPGLGSNTETILIQAAPPYWLLPDPGEYKLTVEATSGELKGTIELKAVITAKYKLSLLPVTERYNTNVTAGKDNAFSVKLSNDGSAPIDNITLSSDKPEGWTIDFTPKEVSSLGVGKDQTIDVNIKPPARTIAGDYSISLRASGKEATAERLEIRVTAETPNIWGWVGVGIILVVVAGLVLIIMRFSRR